MSLIIIDNPFEGFELCSVCLDIQLRNFRNEIKEQWNALNNDGKFGTVRIPFKLNKKYIWELPVTTVNGDPICMTHFFIGINKRIEMEMAMKEASAKPRLDVAPGSLDGFLKNREN